MSKLSRGRRNRGVHQRLRSARVHTNTSFRPPVSIPSTRVRDRDQSVAERPLRNRGHRCGSSVRSHRTPRDREGVRSVTFTCQAILDPVPLRAQMACIPLRSVAGRRIYKDGGEALSSWADANPQARRLNHWIFARAGNASEVWVLFVVPAETLAPTQLKDGPSASAAHEPRRYRNVKWLVALLTLVDMFLLWGLFIALTARTARISALAVGAAVVLVSGLIFLLRWLPRAAPRRVESTNNQSPSSTARKQ